MGFFFSNAFTASVFTVKCILACTFLNAVLSISFITVDFITTVFSFLHLSNTSMLISVTLSGIIILVKPEQPEKVDSLITVTLSEIVTFVKPLQPEKAYAQISVTLSGITI